VNIFRKLNVVLSERDELIVRKETTDREKMRIEMEVHEERARKTDLQADNLVSLFIVIYGINLIKYFIWIIFGI
jgi:hypothetical protein